MKLKNLLLQLAFLSAFAGVLFKHFHFIGASFLILFSILITLISINVFQVREARQLGFSTFENTLKTSFMNLLFISLSFKIFHWPGASILSILTYALILLLLIYFVFFGNKSNFGSQGNFHLLLFFVFLSLMENGPLKMIYQN